MYRADIHQGHTKLLKMDSDIYRRMTACIGVVEEKRGRRVSESEFIRLAIQQACEKVEAV